MKNFLKKLFNNMDNDFDADFEATFEKMENKKWDNYLSEQAHCFHNKVIKEAEESGKSAAQIEQKYIK